jgi:hypothetical protein
MQVGPLVRRNNVTNADTEIVTKQVAVTCVRLVRILAIALKPDLS